MSKSHTGICHEGILKLIRIFASSFYNILENTTS